MPFEGGTRDRSVHKSVFEFVKTSLTTIGWFAAGRNHKPIVLIAARPMQSSEDTVAVNTVVLVDEGIESCDYEMGSDAAVNKYSFCLEMYAESEAIGRQFMGDVRKILLGQYPGVSIYPIIDLYDHAQNPAVYVQYMDVEDVKGSHPTSKELYQRFWFKVDFTVADYDI